ncbi:DedA family protein [Cellulomonas soli]|uniref:DedA family protein n=1 Tax=Cellulomonas soli TaxID=931535 RepID=UPI003F82F1D9
MTDVARAYGLDGLPVAGVLVALFLIVLARSHGTYWLARAAGRVGTSGRGPAWWRRLLARAGGWSQTPAARRGRALVHRWGPLAVSAAYVTVGLQTAVMLAAGLLRMPYLRFTLASLPGAAAWAAIWGTVGLGAVWGTVRLAAASPWALAALVVALAGLVLARRHGRRRGHPPVDAAADAPGPDARAALMLASEPVRD